MALQVHVQGEIIHQITSLCYLKKNLILRNPLKRLKSSENLQHAADHLPRLQVTSSVILRTEETRRGGEEASNVSPHSPHVSVMSQTSPLDQ